MEKYAIYPGSFDPITEGHMDVIRRALKIFDKVIIAVGKNDDKEHMFTQDERVDMIERKFINYPMTSFGGPVVVPYSCRTAELCKEYGCYTIIRGLRDGYDLEYERKVERTLKSECPSIEVVYFMADDEHKDISSTNIRETYGKKYRETLC